MSRTIFRMISVAAALAALPTAAFAASGTGTTTSKVVSPIAITPGTPLSFGKFASDGSGNTHVDMDQYGTVTCQGASLCGADSPTPGTFDIAGTANQVVSITRPGNFFLYDGANSVEVGNIILSGSGVTVVSYGASTGLINSSGALTFQVTGSLWMTAGTPQGDFAGTYTVVVNYL